MQALCSLLQEYDGINAMVQRDIKACICRVVALWKIQRMGGLSVILWSAQNSGAVVPLCDFHYSITYSPLFTGLPPPFAFGGVCALARARPRMQRITAAELLEIVLLWVNVRNSKTLTKNRDR